VFGFFIHLHRISAFSFLPKKFWHLSESVTTFLPVLASSSLRATLATLPPCLATVLLSSKFSGSMPLAKE